MRELQGRLYFGGDTNSPLFLRSTGLKQALARAIAGCASDTLSSEEPFRVTIAYRLRERGRPASGCQSDAASDLAEVGIGQVWIDQLMDHAEPIVVTFSLILDGNQLVDMIAIRNRLMEHQSLRELVAGLDSVDYNPPIPPPLGRHGDAIRLMEPSLRQSGNGLQVLYMHAWGDCLVNCMSAHFWLVALHPLRPVGACAEVRCYAFDVDLVREWGTPLGQGSGP